MNVTGIRVYADTSVYGGVFDEEYSMKKSFDCVEMKRRGAERVYEETKDLTLAEEVEYWRRKGEELRQQQEQLRRDREDGAGK